MEDNFETQTVEVTEQPKQSFFQQYREAFASQTMLVIAIMMTIVTALPMITNLAIGALSFDIIKVLITIALWMIYSNAKSDNNSPSGYKLLSGSIFAEQILTWIAVGSFAIITIALFAIGPMLAEAVKVFVSDLPEIPTVHDLENAIEPYLAEAGLSLEQICANSGITLAELEEFAELYIDSFVSNVDIIVTIIGFIGGVIGLIATAIFTVIAILLTKFHKFTKSLASSITNCEDELQNVGFAKGFMLFMGIITIFDALGALLSFNLFNILFMGASCAMYFVLNSFIKKTFQNR